MITKDQELSTLQYLQKCLEDNLEDTPKVSIVDIGEHHCLSVGWAMIASFNCEGLLTLSFDEDVNPFISAFITNILNANNINFILMGNYYYSPSDQAVYYGDEAINKKRLDTFGNLQGLKSYDCSSAERH